MKFHENPSSGSRVVSCGRKSRTERRTDITKLIVVFRNFAKPPKPNGFKPYREIMALYYKNNMGLIRTLRNKCRVFDDKPGGTDSYR